ncbi:MAG: adenylyl-sulfate kinase [Planctomycetota bacterium]
MDAASFPSSRETDLLRFITAGSVDDGKSTLIGRLLYETESIWEDQLVSVRDASRRLQRGEMDLSLVIDGLRAEREQAITIDVAYRHFATPRRRFIIADCPGHEQYTRNMATGASTADLAVLLVDARQGVLVQTKRHAFILSLLGVPHMVLAVNKMDQVGYAEDAFNAAVGEFRSFAARLEIRDLVAIPLSALRGDNVKTPGANMPWYRGPSLLQHLEDLYIASDRNLVDLRLPIQGVIRPHQDFRGFAGRMASGVIRQGDDVMVLPSGRVSRVADLFVAGRKVTHAFPPQSVMVCLEHDLDVGRGDMIVHPANQPRKRAELEAMLIWMDPVPLKAGKVYLVKHATTLVKGCVSRIRYRVDPNSLHRQETAEFALNDIGRVEIELFKPLLYDEYRHNRATGRFILIDPESNATVGAGVIIERKGGGRLDDVSSDDVAKRHVIPVAGRVDSARRAGLLGQKPCTIWLTGLSGSGKTTIAHRLEERLVGAGRACFVLDGDDVRHGLCRDLGFSPEGRSENIRRAAEVVRLMNEAGLIVVTAFISPYRRDREAARQIVGKERFLEVFVDADLEVCETRDPKGLYKKARSGEIPDFTGISSAYEPPETPDRRIPTAACTVEEAVEMILRMVAERIG